MDYTSQDPYRRDDGRGGVPHRADSDSSGTPTSPGSRPLQRQGGAPHRTSRSVSTTRSTATGQGQTQFSDPYGTGTVQNWPSTSPVPPSAPYNIPPNQSQQAQQYTSSTQSQVYPPVQEEPYSLPVYPPSGVAPPVPGSGLGYDRSHRPPLQQPAATQSYTYATQTQYHDSQFQGRQHDYPQHTPQQASLPHHSQQQQYPPQQTYSPPQQAYSPPQQAYSPPQQAYSPPQQAYSPPQQAHSPPQQAYSPPQQAYSPPQQAYSLPQQAYLPPQQAYLPPQQAYSPSQRQHSPSGHTIDHVVPHSDATSPGVPSEEHKRRKRLRTDPGPICRFPNCHEPARKDGSTNELTEYCGDVHMREDMRRGVALCPSCRKYPRRLDGGFCGSACTRWAADQNRQQPVESGSYYSSERVAVAGSHTMASGGVAYGSANYAAAGVSYQSGGYPKAVHQSYRPPGPQPVEGPPSRPVGGLPVRPVGGLLSCPRCGGEYPAGHRPLPPCPYCSRTS